MCCVSSHSLVFSYSEIPRTGDTVVKAAREMFAISGFPHKMVKANVTKRTKMELEQTNRRGQIFTNSF